MESYYEVYELIGEGSFGRVYRARCRQTNNFVAFKIISKNNRQEPEIVALRKECEIQKNLRHPNIIQMLCSFETNHELVVVTEFAQKDLCRVLEEEGVFPEDGARKIILDLVNALRYLHCNRVLHRDLKPQNVLLDSNGTAKLCDFGFAKILGNDGSVFASIKGTPLYMAPELMNESTCDYNADLWSLGCIAYELVTGHPPYTTTSILELIRMIKLEPVKWPDYLSKNCLSFLKGLLQKDPVCRLSWPYLLHHPFISAVSFKPSFNEALCVAPVINKSISPAISDIACNRNYENMKTEAKLSAQKEEWLEFLKKTIWDVMYNGDIEVLTEKHLLMLIMNALNSCNLCPIIVMNVSRLLSLPFVVKSISETQSSLIKQTYFGCGIMHDLLTVVKLIILNISNDKYINSSQEDALQQLLLLICYLTFTGQNFLKQYFNTCVSLNLFQELKTLLLIRTKNEPHAIVKYVISIFLRLYVLIPPSRKLIVTAFQSCTSEFHLLFEEKKDASVQIRLCIFIMVLNCTHPNFMNNKLDDIHILIKNLDYLMNSNISSNRQIAADSALEILQQLQLKDS